MRLGDYFGKKPVILSLVYFGCPMLCTMAENGLLHSLQEVKFSVGREFDVLTVSFDPHDTPELAAAKKAVYVGLYGRKGAERGWHFLTGDEASDSATHPGGGIPVQIRPAGQAVRSCHGDHGAHPSRQNRALFLRDFLSFARSAPGLGRGSANKIGSPVDEVLLFCCRYDPATGKYGVIISRILQIAGLMTLLLLEG